MQPSRPSAGRHPGWTHRVGASCHSVALACPAGGGNVSLREDEPPEGGVTCGVAVTERPPSRRKAGGSGSYLCGAGPGFSVRGSVRRGALGKRSGRAAQACCPLPSAPPHGAHTGSWRHGGLGRQHTSKWELQSWQGRWAHVGSHPRPPVAQRATCWACPRVCLGTTHVCTRRTACASPNDTG